MTENADTLWTRVKERWFLMLFATPFAAVGIGMLFFSIVPQMLDWKAVKSWDRAQAQLEQVELKSYQGDDSTTYEVLVRYHYNYKGITYHSRRVGLSSGADNVGDFHQREASRLERSWRSGEPVAVWVNPEAPSESVLNRELRFPLILFSLVFVIVFGGVGCGMWAYCLLARSDKMPGERTPTEVREKPWQERRDWASREIKSNGKASVYVSWVFAVFWNAIAIPASIGALQEAFKGQWLALLVLLFPLVGAGLLVWAVKTTLGWRRFGPAPLLLDPYPGSIGGQVGGTIDINLAYRSDQYFHVNLKCLRSYMSGSGKDRSRREQLKWQSEGVAVSSPGGKGTHLEILFDVEDGVPASEEPSDSYHLWRLDVRSTLDGVDFERSYELPVFATKAKAQSISQLASNTTHALEAREQALDHILNVEQVPGGVILHYPAFRHPGSKLVLIVVGVVFTAIGWLVPADDFPSWIFSLIGLPMLLWGLYSLLSALDVRIDRTELVTRRRLLGVSLGNRHYPRHMIKGLSLKESYSYQSGSKHVTYYKIMAERDDGKSVTVGFNLAGKDLARTAIESLSVLTGLAIL